jgi:hypothetical protein
MNLGAALFICIIFCGLRVAWKLAKKDQLDRMSDREVEQAYREILTRQRQPTDHESVDDYFRRMEGRKIFPGDVTTKDI